MRSRSISVIAQSRAMSVASGVILATLWILFSMAHLKQFNTTGDLSTLLLIIAETLAAAFYLMRSGPSSVSISPLDWLIAVLGTFTPLLLRPSDFSVIPEARHLMALGAAMLILGLASLNRSFAIVPANRKIKTNMMYRMVRHPIYASYCVLFASYVLVNTSTFNLAVYATLIFLLVARIHREEKHLMEDQAYRAYASQVRFRLVPFVY